MALYKRKDFNSSFELCEFINSNKNIDIIGIYGNNILIYK